MLGSTRYCKTDPNRSFILHTSDLCREIPLAEMELYLRIKVLKLAFRIESSLLLTASAPHCLVCPFSRSPFYFTTCSAFISPVAVWGDGVMEGWREGGMTVWINCAVLLLQFTHSSRPIQANSLYQHRGLLNTPLLSHSPPRLPLWS